MGRKCGCCMMMVFILCLVVPTSMGLSYTVGDSSGWTLGVDYAAWSSSKTFVIGDTLVFKYGSGHTVDEVSESDYNTCKVGNPINRDNKGSTTILLQTPGNRFFICGVIGHCGSGMKLSVNVFASSTPTTGVAPGGASNSTTTTTTNSGAEYGGGVLPATTIPDVASLAPASFVSFHGGVTLIVILGLAYVYMF